MTAALNRVDTLFMHNAATLAGRTHLILPDHSTQTYDATYERARRIAQVIVGAGVARGDRVLVFCANSRELVEMYIACSLAATICVPVNTLTTARELINTAADCAPRAAFIQAQFMERLSPQFLAHDLMLKVVIGGAIAGWSSYDGLVERGTPIAGPLSLDPEDPSVMIYSSGTTGLPKGILLRQRAVIDNALMTNTVMRYQMSDVFVTMLPLFSSFGYCWDFLMAGQCGAKTVLLPRFDPGIVADLVERHRITTLIGVPTMFARIFDPENIKGRDFSSVRLMDVGGGPVSDRLKHDLKQTFGIEIVESYGLTEISPVSSVQIPWGVHKVGSCGPALPGIEVKVLDENDREVAPNIAGELCFRCSTFMIGYWNKPELSERTLRDGWLHSGDIGIVDEDGHIHFRDRLKDMIVSSGNNVYPKEVENAVCEHPAVQSCAVIGIPDEIRGENVHAFVILKSGAKLTEADVVSHCSDLIGRHKLPRGVTFLDELPLTASGKIQRFQLREMVKAKAAR